jgi:hypothetical protein
MPNAMQVINAGLYADRIVEVVLKWQAANEGREQNRHDCKTALKAAGFSVLGAGFYGFVIAGPADTEFVVKVCIDANDGYPMYAKWAKANPMPGIIPVWLAERITDTCFVAVLPRLKDMENYSEKYKPYAEAARNAVFEALEGFANEDLHDGNWLQCEDGTVVISDPFAGLYVDREKAESTAQRGEYKPSLRDQFDMFEPTPAQRQAIRDAKIAAENRVLGRRSSAGPMPMAQAPMGGAWPQPAPMSGCNCPMCVGMRGKGRDKQLPEGVQVIKPRLAGKVFDIMLLDEVARQDPRKRWAIDGFMVGELEFRAWDIAKPLMRPKQEPDMRLIGLLAKAAQKWGVQQLFANLPVQRVRYVEGLNNWKAQDSNRLGMAVPIKERLELDFNELERRVMANAGGRIPDGRALIQQQFRPNGWPAFF